MLDFFPLTICGCMFVLLIGKVVYCECDITSSKFSKKHELTTNVLGKSAGTSILIISRIVIIYSNIIVLWDQVSDGIL